MSGERRVSSTRLAIEQIALRVAEQTAEKMSEHLMTTVSLLAEKMAHDIYAQLQQSGSVPSSAQQQQLRADAAAPSAAGQYKAAKPAISRPKTPADNSA